MTVDANRVTYKEIAVTILLKLLPLSVAVVVVFKFLHRLLAQAGTSIPQALENGVLLIALLVVVKVSAGKMIRKLFSEGRVEERDE